MKWPTVKLKSVTSKVGSGATPRGGEAVYKDAGVPLIRSMNVHFDGFRRDGLVYIDEEEASLLNHVEIQSDDVLFNITGASIGRVTTAPADMAGARVNQHVCILRPTDKLMPQFLSYYMRSPDQQVLVGNNQIGGTRQAVTKGMLLNWEIHLPPLAEQGRIVKLLNEADELRKLRAQADRRTANLIPALFHEMFGDPDENLKSWLVFPFGELLAEPLRNGLSPAKDGRYRAKVLTLSAITGKGFDGSAWKEASFARLPDKNCQTTGHLFLICRGNGNRELVGRAKFSQYAAEGVVFPDTMIAGVPKTDRLLPLFLEEAWNLPATRGQISSGARTTNGTFKINQTVIEQIRLPVPPLTLQKEFAARVSEIRAVQAEQSASRRRLDDLFQSLLHRAFKGEL